MRTLMYPVSGLRPMATFPSAPVNLYGCAGLNKSVKFNACFLSTTFSNFCQVSL